MNERIKELLEDATEVYDDRVTGKSHRAVDYKIFAELIVRECIKTLEEVPPGYRDYRDQIENAMRDACIEALKIHFEI